jgi:aspartate racemase
MPKAIGIVACSAEGAALCYRTICAEAATLMGPHAHPEIAMHTFPLSDYMGPIDSGDWESVARLMAESARRTKFAGADFAVCPDNTIHQAYDRAVQESPLPWLHIADAVADEAERGGYRHLGILGTRYLMEGPVYPSKLEPRGIARQIPDQAERERINRIIFDELVYGVFKPDSEAYFYQVIGQLKQRGCDAVVLGCTEIPLIVSPEASPLPLLDSTRLLARAALRFALE